MKGIEFILLAFQSAHLRHDILGSELTRSLAMFSRVFDEFDQFLSCWMLSLDIGKIAGGNSVS